MVATFALILLRFGRAGLLFADIASPKWRVRRALREPDPDAFPCRGFFPDYQPLSHGVGLKSLRGLVNQS